MARNVKTDSKVEGRKEEVEIVKPAMLKAARTLRDGDTIGRLRRGFGSTQGPRPVDAMARAACFSRRQFHRLMVQVLGETPGTHQRRLRLDRGAWLLLTSRATDPGCRSRNWIRESRDFYARLSHPVWRHALRFSQESRNDAAAINSRCPFHRNPRGDHSAAATVMPKNTSNADHLRHAPSQFGNREAARQPSGKRSRATSICGGRKISTPRNHRNALSSK